MKAKKTNFEPVPKSQINSIRLLHSKSYLTKIAIKEKNRYHFVNTEDIKYIKSSSYYAEIYTQKEVKHLYRISSMGNLIKRLDPQIFMRINRSSIVNINEIKELISEGLGEHSILMKDQTAFSLSKNYKKEVFAELEIKN